MAELVLWWQIANSGTSPGSVGWGLEDDGWPGFIADRVEPAISWCEATGVTPTILIHSPFGAYYDENVRINTYDYANAYGLSFLTRDFASQRGWRSVTSRVDCYVYTGGCDITDYLRDLPPIEQAKTIKRNLKPIQQAGFKGVYIDYAENAIPSAYVYNSDPDHAQSARRSVDYALLSMADEMFPEAAGIEAAPRAFSAFNMLWDRNLVAQDEEWRYRYGGMTTEQYTLYGYRGRNSNHVALGYDRSVLTGEVWRTIPYDDDGAKVQALAELIVGEGDVAAVCPAPLITDGILASDLI